MKTCIIKQQAGIGDIFFCQKIAMYMRQHGYQIIWTGRPSIPWIRDYIKDAPILALTATATDQVANDIQDNLKFARKNKIQSSFIRDNISHILIKENNKKKR